MSKLSQSIRAIGRSPFLWGILGSVGFYALVHYGPLGLPLVKRYFAGHPVEYMETIMFAVGLAAATLMIGRLTALAAGDKLIIAALIGCSVCLASFAVFESIWIWFAARFFLGFCASVIFMLSEAWLNTACPDRLRGRAAGLYGAGLCAGFAAGPLAIPLFGSENGFAFALIAVYTALVAFGTAILSRKARTKPQASSAGGLIHFIRRGPVLVGMVLAFGFADITAISVMPVYFIKIGHSESFAAFSVTIMALPTAVAQPLVGMLLDKISRPAVATACAFVAAFSFLVIPYLQSQFAILVVFAIMGAASVALYTCALTLLGERYTGGLLLTGSAVISLAYAIGSAAGSTATGFAMDIFGPSRKGSFGCNGILVSEDGNHQVVFGGGRIEGGGLGGGSTTICNRLLLDL